MADTVKVCCRFRPMNAMERADGSGNSGIVFDPDEKGMSMKGGRKNDSADAEAFRCTFDHIFTEAHNQEYVFKYTAAPIVKDVMTGYNCTIFAYGQTGSGKTHTMMGDPDEPSLKGIIPRIVEALFDAIVEADGGTEFTVKISIVEIYNEKIRDLLDVSKTNLKIRDTQGGVWIEDVSEVYAGSDEQVLEVLEKGVSNRAVGATSMNEESSRSHSVFIITLNQRHIESGSTINSKLFLVDLAGSEKVRKSQAAGQRLDEAKFINKSLSALGNVINALTKGSGHVPYRDSKLTRILSDSLGGNSKTCMIITASSALFNAEETLSTLRFGVRAKEIKNKAIINQERSVAEYKRLLEAANEKIALQERIIANLKEDIELLRASLAEKGGVDPTVAKYAKLEKMKETGVPGKGGTSDPSLLMDASDMVTRSFKLEKMVADLKEENEDLKNQMNDYQQLQTENEQMNKEADEVKSKLASAGTKEQQVESMLKEYEQFRAKVAEREQRHTVLVTALKKERDDLIKNQSQSDVTEAQQILDAGDAPAGSESMLQKSLRKKCQQYIDLQVVNQSQSDRIAILEQALETASQKASQTDYLKQNIELRKKLAASEKVCKKLLNSGMYWRQRRRKSAHANVQRIVMPIKGGGQGVQHVKIVSNPNDDDEEEP